MSAPSSHPTSPRTAAWLARSVTATWWYTASSVVFFQIMTLAFGALVVLLLSPGWAFWVYAGGGVLGVASAIALLMEYRRRTTDLDHGPGRMAPRAVWGIALAAVAAVLVGVGSGSALLGAAQLALVVCLVRWAPGLRWRLVVAITLALAVVWAVEVQAVPVPSTHVAVPTPYFAIVLPSAAVLSMWWWDVVVALDHARAIESRLAATQERLRLAGDLHDLQGHHLQVIALQLELAERMLPRDPAAAAEQVHLARASVDAARQGTRELAGRFRGVPLPDELANAADLLRAAGVSVELDVADDAGQAPSAVLGPVVREITTNVLKHGGGVWAQLSLQREGSAWRLRVANDPRGAAGAGSGSGLAGIGERVGAAGGDVHVSAHDHEFEVAVTVPVVAVSA